MSTSQYLTADFVAFSALVAAFALAESNLTRAIRAGKLLFWEVFPFKKNKINQKVLGIVTGA